MFEGAVAAFLNRLLGRYVEDLDTEQFNVGIFSGDTCLTDLKLKPEALYQLGLPIRVEIGLIGKIILKIPWSGLFSQPIVICIEDIYAVAVPALSGPYNQEIQKHLIRAEKRKILDDLKENEIFRAGLPPQLFDGLLALVTKNFQITINNVHIRYEEKILRNFLCACGICIQSISLTTTNNKWKPGVCATNSQTVYQLIRAESLSIYMDHDTESCINIQGNWDMPNLLAWKSTMHGALQTFGMKNKEFQFLLKPFTAKIKVIIHKGTEMQVSRMLVDIVLQDVAMQLSEAQYATFYHIHDSLLRGIVNRPHVKYRPEKSVYEEPLSWWKYAYNSILNHYIKPYTWSHIAEHRRNYRKYKEACIQSLQRPNDTELKLDLQKYEDSLTIFNIVIAREHARQELRNKDIERECQKTIKDPLKGVKAKTMLTSNDQTQSITDNSPDSKVIPEKSLKQIDYKLNFTLANCCLSLLSKSKEILVITVAQFLTSIEARPTLLAFKISVRAESFVVEAISTDGDLVPLITVDNVLTGNVSTYFLAIDFEKNGLNMDPIFEVSIKLEAIEVTYHHFAMVEIVNFFKFNTNYIRDTILGVYRLWDSIKRKYLSFVDDIVSQTLRISLKIDIKSPYIIFPEHGSIQKGGHILVLDLGNIMLINELQAINLQLEDATLMELEELLYDRLNIMFCSAQILFCHSGDDWRSARKQSDSEYHLLPKLQANATLSYSIRPEYRQLPRTKLNVHISNMKFNLTESKLRLIAYFLNKLLVTYENNVEKYKAALKDSTSERKSSIVFTSAKELLKIQSNVCLPSVTMMHSDFKSVIKEVVTNSVPKLDRSVVSSEVSEEDLELLSKTINLSGFDDNISPCNHINLLLRFSIGEFSINLEHVVDNREQPYLNLILHTLYYETAIMEYGVAIQFGIGSILLVDKTNAGVTGSYLELMSTDESYEVLVVSYRKVKSNCPDFKLHFKNIERSLIVNIFNININFHRSALLKMENYWHKFQAICHGTLLFKFIEKMCSNIMKWEEKDVDPPIPPGAIKLNYSTRLRSLVLRFCDRDIDLMEIKFLGLENDCIYNANERMVFRAHLRNILAEDLNDDTLYSKILTTDEDKVFDLKYVRHTPKYRCSDIDTHQDDVMSDGTFKLCIGRTNCVIISKTLYDLRNFVRPFTSAYYIRFLNYLESKFVGGIEMFKRSATKLHIFIDIQGPTFLLPQKKDAPSLLVFDTGVLSVENFFKNSGQLIQSTKAIVNDGNQLIIDNILVKLKSMTVSRAIMTLTRDLEVQEPIIEPIHIQFDIKRKTEFCSIIEFQTYGLFNIQGAIDIININLSQRDLKSLISVWQDNISKIPLFKKIGENEDQISTQGFQKNIKHDDDVMVKKLEDFLTHNETALCEVNVKLTLEGLQLNLFMDTEEVLSSPVRDLNHGLCKLSFGETINTWDFYSNKSLKMKLSLQNCLLQDTRKDSVIEKKIIQSPAISLEKNLESCISVSMSPIIDVTYNRTQAEEKCLDVLIQDVRMNLFVPFLMHLGRYFLDSLPGEQIEKGIINHGYDNNNQTSRNALNAETDKVYCSQYYKEQPGTSISIRIQKPDIFLFGDLEKSNTHVIRMQAEVFIESSRHSCSSSIVCTLTNVNAKTRGRGNYGSPSWLLRPCDIEISKRKELSSGNEEITVVINSVNIHLSVEVVYTFIDILNETTAFLNSLSLKADDSSNNQNTNITSMQNNLWTPMKVSSIPYKKTDEGESEQYCHHNNYVIFNLRPVLVCLLLEMEYSAGRFPVMRMETVITTTINDWHNNFHLESNVKLHAFCYNKAHQNWEPFVEFCTKDDVNYKPWEFTIKTYQGETNVISSNWIDPCHHIKQDLMKTKKRDTKHNGQDETDMIFIGPDDDMISFTRNESETYIVCEDGSDTDDDTESDTKLAKISNYLFNNSSDDEESDSDNSSTNEDEELELMLDCNSVPYNSVVCASAKANPSASHIILYSEDKMNITITQNMIVICNAISNAFSQAKNGIPFVSANTRELTLLNDIGHASRVELLVQEQVNGNNVTRVVAAHNFHDGNSPTSVPSSPENETQADLTSPQWVSEETIVVVSECKVFPTNSPVHIYKSITGELLHVIFEGFEDVLVYCPKKETCHLISLRPVRHEVRYYLVIEVSINNYLHRTICVRSPLQFRNETSYALGLYYKKAVIDKLGLTPTGEATNPFDHNVRIAIIEPDAIYNIPLYISYHCTIHILPAYLEKYQVSNEGIYWKDLRGSVNVFKDVCCETKGDINRNVFCVRAICTEVPLMTRPSGCQVPNYLINIIPPIVFNNQLPFVIDVNIPGINYEVKIEPGEKINMHSLNCNSNTQFIFKIHNYLGTSWVGAVKLNMNLERKFVLMSTDNESDLTKPFLLCLELCKILSWNIIVQSQYWIINKSSLPLFIQDCNSHIIYEMPEEDLMMFSQKNNKKNNMVRLRVHQSEWSMPFGLDGITSMSLVVCRDIERGRKYQLLTEIESSRLSPIFTKIITFLPYFFICSKTKRTLRFMEENEEADLWNDLLPGQEMSFWPVTESMKMRIKWRNSQVVSQHFDITHTGKTVLRMDNGSALCVEIEGGINTPYRITFRRYIGGDIPVRVDNLCDKLFLKLNQVGLGQVVLLKPFQSLLYTWDDPTKNRELIWNVYNNNAVGYKAQFETDGCGHEKVFFVTVERRDSVSHSSITPKSLANAKPSWSEDTNGSFIHLPSTESEAKPHIRQDEVEVYWVSYMEGEQRVLLFTQHESVYLKAKSIIDSEASKREIFLSIAAIGISVIVQESNLHPVRRELLYASVIDSVAHWELYFSKRWRSLSLELSAWLENKYTNSAKRTLLENFIDVDFTKMQITKPFFGKLRRTYSPGIWLHCRESTTLCYLQGYVHRIQIDNQLNEATFPVVLYPNLQKTFVNYAGGRRLKHCLEFSYLKQRKLKNIIYKGICVIIRKLNLNLEETFLCALINLIPKKPETKHSIAAKLRKDVSNMRIPSVHKISNILNSKRKDIIEQIYISPMTLRLKLLANTNGSNTRNFSNVFDYHNILRFIFEYAEKGIFEKEAEFRLPDYRKSFIVVDNEQFLLHLSRIYSVLIIEQFHVLVRLTTVLGNQYSYNFKSPGSSFSEPDLLLLYGDEPAERLAHQVACELGYATLDGMQTSILNSHNAHALNFKMKDTSYQNPEVPPLTFLIDHSFIMEIDLETSGLITTSTNSIHREELKYFFKTLGKKISILFKAESSYLKTHSKIIADLIKRAQEVEHNFVLRVRLPRYINPHFGVELFSTHKAKGAYLLNAISKDHCVQNDSYWGHTALHNDGKYITLVSLKRIHYIEKGNAWGSWNVKWALETNQLLSPPTIVKNKLILHVTKNEEETSSSMVDWYVESESTDILEWLCRKMNSAMILNMENICSK